MKSQQRIIEACRQSLDMQNLGATAEGLVLELHPELEPGSEEFYAEVLVKMGIKEHP